MKPVIVASIGERNELGRDGDLCWHIREDLKHFKQLTLGGAVIMGRKTWESLPRKPLPGRLNIVISSARVLPGIPSEEPSEVVLVSSLEEALEKAQGFTPFIIGGASVYRAAMPMAGRLEITRIFAAEPDADTFFPEIDPRTWTIESASEVMTSQNGLRFQYVTYENRSSK